MTLNIQSTLLDYGMDYEMARSLGEPMLACNAMIVPEIAPHLALLAVNFPRPIVTMTEPVDYAYAGGMQTSRVGVPKTHSTGNLQFIETDVGIMQGFAELVMANGGETSCIVYDGRVGRYDKAYKLPKCAITFEPQEIDAEGRSTIIKVSAPMSYMYFGLNVSIGKSTPYMGQVKSGNSGFDDFLDKANNLLNIVRSGNNLVRALGDMW
jgi:hypothetical protein